MGRRRRISTWVKNTLLIVCAVAFSIPMYVAVTGAFRDSTDIVRQPLALPFSGLTLDNFRSVFDDPTFNVWKSYAVSASVTLVSTTGLLLVAGMFAFYLSRGPARTTRILMAVLLVGFMIPPAVILLPSIQVLRAVGLIFTFPGLILYNMGVFLAFSCFVLVRFIDAIPRELDEAATLDGAGPMRLYWRIIVPLTAPALATLSILLFIFIWADFLGPLLLLGSRQDQPITVGVYQAIGAYTADFGRMFAYILLASGPIVALYLFTQRRVIGAVTDGAVKG